MNLWWIGGLALYVLAENVTLGALDRVRIWSHISHLGLLGDGFCLIFKRGSKMGWNIEGQYVETCNCAFLCPCITSNLSAKPTEGDCKAAIAMRIDSGEKDGVSLNGLSFVVLLHSQDPW